MLKYELNVRKEKTKQKQNWTPSDREDRKLYDSHSIQRTIFRAGGFNMRVFEYSGGEGLFSIEIMTHSPSVGKLPSDEPQISNLPMCLSTHVTTLYSTEHQKNMCQCIKLYFCFKNFSSSLHSFHHFDGASSA